jgi:hypothetical protein
MINATLEHLVEKGVALIAKTLTGYPFEGIDQGAREALSASASHALDA